MPNVQQVYQIVNDIGTQALGKSPVTGTFTNADFVDIGTAILSSETALDSFYKILVDRIGRTIFSQRRYEEGDSRFLRRTEFEWGSILQKVNFALPTAVENPTWNAQDNAYADPFTKSQTVIEQLLFDTISTWEVDRTLKDYALRTAFRGPEEMSAYISGVLMAAENAMTLAEDNMDNLALASLIARRTLNSSGVAMIDLTEGLDVKGADALTSPAFYQHAIQTILLTSDRMTKMSQLFNGGSNIARHTPKDLQVLHVLSNFAQGAATYLQANTYHDELIRLPMYHTVPYWQGAGESYALTDASAISVTITDNGAAKQVAQNGIVAVLHDYESVGTTVRNKRTRSIYNPKEEYTNYFFKADIGYFNDLSENCVIFYIGGLESPSATTVSTQESSTTTSKSKVAK